MSTPSTTAVPVSTKRRLQPNEIIAVPIEPIEVAKRLAARQAVDDWIQNNMVVGIGSGSTIVYAIQRLAERVHSSESLQIRCIPTSFQARTLIVDTGMILSDLSQDPVIDVAIDGADEVEPTGLHCIKGGGGCHVQEKLIAVNSNKFIVIADNRKQAKQLLTVWRKGIPVEVLPLAYTPIMQKLEQLGGKPVLRMCSGGKAGPIVTDNGNFIIDVDFGNGQGISNPVEIHTTIKMITGVIDTGIFTHLANQAYFGNSDGTVEIWKPTIPK